MSVQESCLSRGIKRCGYHVCVLGTIGSGKTTLTEALQKVLKERFGACEGLYEPVGENPWLELFYKDKKKYAFEMQVYMLNRRLEQQRRAQANALCGVHSVQDSSLFGDSCFVEMLHRDGDLTDMQVDLYSSLFVNMSTDVMYPTLVVYLNCPASVAKRRIERRGRECEKSIELKYLDDLNHEIGILCKDFQRYTFVKEINAIPELTLKEIEAQANLIVDELKLIRESPIISRMGV